MYLCLYTEIFKKIPNKYISCNFQKKFDLTVLVSDKVDFSERL